MSKMFTITGDSIPLPKAIARKWRGARAVLDESGVQLVRPGRMTEWRKLKGAGRLVSQREIAAAVRAVRAEAQ